LTDHVTLWEFRIIKRLLKRIFVDPGLLPLAVLSGVAGAGAGLICGLFRLALEEAERLRISLPAQWQDEALLGCSLFVTGAAGAGAFSAWLVHRFCEQAAGSGIPHVEAVINEELPPANFLLVPVKFAGGVTRRSALASLSAARGHAYRWAQPSPIFWEKSLAAILPTAGRY
jgi:H+/Cl- antiporter ClcA